MEKPKEKKSPLQKSVHDLNNVLTAVITSLDLIIEDEKHKNPKNEKLVRDLEDVFASALKGPLLVEQMWEIIHHGDHL